MALFAARHQRQIIAHKIGSDGHTHKKQAEPEPPITVSAPPVRRNLPMNMLAIRYFIVVVTVVTFMH
jgi:hypothetical protein